MNWTRLFLVPLLVGGLALVGCRAEQTREGELPDVDVEGGQAPQYDVETADVDVTTDTQTVEVPDVDVNPPE